MRIEVTTKLGCDFCGQSQDNVEEIICGTKDICICSECVDLCVKLCIDTSEAEAAIAALEKREAAIVNSDLVGAIPIGLPTRAEYAEAARKWADEVTSDVIFGLPRLPDMLLKLVAIRQGLQ